MNSRHMTASQLAREISESLVATSVGWYIMSRVVRHIEGEGRTPTGETMNELMDQMDVLKALSEFAKLATSLRS